MLKLAQWLWRKAERSALQEIIIFAQGNTVTRHDDKGSTDKYIELALLRKFIIERYGYEKPAKRP